MKDALHAIYVTPLVVLIFVALVLSDTSPRQFARQMQWNWKWEVLAALCWTPLVWWIVALSYGA